MAAANIKSDHPRTLAQWLVGRHDWLLKDRLLLVQEIAGQVQELHGKGQIHRAISIDTVTVDELFRPQLPPPEAPRHFGDGDSDPEFCPPWLSGDRGVVLPKELDVAAEALNKAGYAFDPRLIDVYQLGLLICRLVTGEPIVSYIYDATTKDRVPPAARPLLDRTLGFDSLERFGSCNELITALDKAIAEAEVSTHDTPAIGSAIMLDSDTPPHGFQGAFCRPTTQHLRFDRLGHFRILEQIGGGGMGDVYRGYDESLDRDVAIKVLPPQFARDTDFVRRFYAEATAAASIAHPNVVPIYFIGEDRGHHFFAMQFVVGESLADRLGRQGRFSVNDAVECISQCSNGLQAAHARGLIHRDIKPGNVLIERETGRAMLVDFGLVRRLAENSKMTATGVVMGTVDYIAPEQARGGKIDARTDIYSLGVLFYQLLSGRLPFMADSPTAMIFQHAYETPFPLKEAAPDAPLPVLQIVARMMAKEPENRYSDCGAVLADLAAFQDGRPLARAACLADEIGREPQRQSDSKSWDAEDLPVQADVLEPQRWQGVRDWAATMFRRNAPKFVQEMQGTVMQMDAVVAQHERQRNRLAKLLQEASSLENELTEEEVEDLQRQFDATEATLAKLRSQQNVLKARLQAAEAKQKLESGMPQAKRPRPWLIAAALGTSVMVFTLLFAIGVCFLWMLWRSSDVVLISPPAKTAPVEAPPKPIAAPAPSVVLGEWKITLPNDKWLPVSILSIGPSRYNLLRAGVFSGIYKVDGDRMVVEEPNDKRLTEFVWQMVTPDKMILVGSPDVRKIGSDYLGSVLTRVTGDGIAAHAEAMLDRKPALPKAIMDQAAVHQAYVLGDRPYYQIMSKMATDAGLSVGPAFNTSYDTYLPRAKGHILLVETHHGKPIVSKEVLEAYFPKAFGGLATPSKAIRIDDTVIVFVEFPELHRDIASVEKRSPIASSGGAVNNTLSLCCEAQASTAVTLQLKTASHPKVVRDWHVQTPTSIAWNPNEFTPDSYNLFVSADGYASQVVNVRISHTAIQFHSDNLMLYRKRYVVLRYACNHDGSRDLSPAKTKQGRVAVPHWGQIPDLRGDWQVWQKGTDLYFELHRYSSNFGFAKAPAQATFDALGLAPENDSYASENLHATPGQIFFARIAGNNPSEQCYAKIEVQQITEQPPSDVKVIAGR